MPDLVAEAVEALHGKLDVMRAEALVHRTVFGSILQALHVIITQGNMTMAGIDHDALLALAKELDGKADAAVHEFDALEADHGQKVQALDDIGEVLKGIGAKLDGIKAPAGLVPSPVAGQTSL